MKDYLRTNSKWILAIFSCFLMLAWLVNPNNKDPGDRKNAEPVGTLDGKTVTKGGIAAATNALELLKRVPIGSYDVERNSLGRVLQMQLQLDPHVPDVHLYLLLTEAKKYGVSVSQQEVSQLFLSYFQEVNRLERIEKPFDPATLDDALVNLALSMKSTTDDLRAAVATVLTGGKARLVDSPTLDPSVPELKHITAETMTHLDTQFVQFDATTPAADAPQPTAAEIREQFEAYKSVLPAGLGAPRKINGHDYPFGYKYPDRVQVEYLIFDHEAIRKSPRAKPTLEDQQEARRRYDDNPKSYMRKVDPTATQPSTQPDRLSFAEAKEEILGEIIDGHIDALVKEMAAVVDKHTQENFGPTTDADGYRVLKDPKAPLFPYSKIADQIEQAFQYRPTVCVGTVAAGTQPATASAPASTPESATADWLDVQQLNKLPGIGQAAYVSQGKIFAYFADMALNVREVHPTADIKKMRAIYRQLQVGMEAQPLVDGSRNTYIFRVIGAKPEAEPASMAEVQDQIILDLRRKATYEKNEALAKEIADAAAKAGPGTEKDPQTGLSQVAAKYNLITRQTGMFAPLNVVNAGGEQTVLLSQQDANIPIIGLLPEYASAAYLQGAMNANEAKKHPKTPATAPAASAPAKPATAPASAPATANATSTASAPATAPASPATTMYLGGGHPVGVVASEARLSVYVFEVTAFEPPTFEAFEQNRTLMARYRLARPPLGLGMTDLQILAKRLKFVPEGGDFDTTPMEE